jgi:hypothetical protein
MIARRSTGRRRLLALAATVAVTAILLCPSMLAAGILDAGKPCHGPEHSESSGSTAVTTTCCLAEKPQIEVAPTPDDVTPAVPVVFPAHTATVAPVSPLPSRVARSAPLTERSSLSLFVRHGALRR